MSGALVARGGGGGGGMLSIAERRRAARAAATARGSGNTIAPERVNEAAERARAQATETQKFMSKNRLDLLKQKDLRGPVALGVLVGNFAERAKSRGGEVYSFSVSVFVLDFFDSHDQLCAAARGEHHASGGGGQEADATEGLGTVVRDPATGKALVLSLPAMMPKDDARSQEERRALVGSTRDVEAGQQHFFSVPMSDLGTVQSQSGALVVLRGIRARFGKNPPPLGSQERPFLNVARIEQCEVMAYRDLYAAIVDRQVHTSWLSECTLEYNEADPSSRYDEHTPVMLVVEQPANAEYFRFCVANNVPIVTPLIDSEKRSWTAGKDEKNPTMAMSVPITVQQWEGEYAPEKVTSVFLRYSVYEEVLQNQFRICDVDTWLELAPMLAEWMSFAALTVVDVKNSRGLTASDKHAFALALQNKCFMTDVPDLYRTVGLPVTKEHVARRFKVADYSGDGEVRETRVAPDVVSISEFDENLTRFGDTQRAFRSVRDVLHHPRSRIFALIKCDQPRQLARLDAEQGARLLDNPPEQEYEHGDPLCNVSVKPKSLEQAYYVAIIERPTVDVSALLPEPTAAAPGGYLEDRDDSAAAAAADAAEPAAKRSRTADEEEPRVQEMQ